MVMPRSQGEPAGLQQIDITLTCCRSDATNGTIGLLSARHSMAFASCAMRVFSKLRAEETSFPTRPGHAATKT